MSNRALALSFTLSLEDVYWIEAIAQRQVVCLHWDYTAAYNEALAAVEGFYQEQLTMYGWIEREIEDVLHNKRIVYEKETARIKELAELQRRHDQQIREARKAQQEQWRKWHQRNIDIAVFQCMFDAAGGRDRWVYREWLKGRSLTSIAVNINRTRERVRGIVEKEIRRLRRPPKSYSPPKGRPVDMGGPRDVWLTYYPPPDPRLDNMEPVT